MRKRVSHGVAADPNYAESGSRQRAPTDFVARFYETRGLGMPTVFAMHEYGIESDGDRPEVIDAWLDRFVDRRGGFGDTGCRSTRRLQTLTLTLDGITSDDYLAWVRNPEPASLDNDLRSITTRTQPTPDRIEIDLVWNREPPNPRDAALAAGFPLAPHVTTLRGGTDTQDRPHRGSDRGFLRR
jgi:hypothetical protein